MKAFYEVQHQYDFLYAISKNELKEYLRGDGKYRKYSASDFYIAFEPTETEKVIEDIFKTEKVKNGSVKMFLACLEKIMEESAVEAYLVFDYVSSLRYEESVKHIQLGPYQDVLEMLEVKMVKYLRNYREDLQGKICFPNGWNIVNPWDEILIRCDDKLKGKLKD